MHDAHISSHEIYRNCSLCPRNCQCDRVAGAAGVCQMSHELRLGSSCAHFGEEPVFSGQHGSGTLFFSGCSCRCFFCQNHQISLDRQGRVVDRAELLQLALELVAQGVHNINLVTPDHFWPHVAELCRDLRRAGVELPIVYNCSGYMTPQLCRAVLAEVDIMLPDFKFADPDLARHCMGDQRYGELALAALTQMVADKGFLEPFVEDGSQPARRGVLVRHLVLPGQVDNSLAVLRLLYHHFGRMLPLSVMSQFQPMPRCDQHRSLTRMLSNAEYEQVCAEVVRLGFKQVFIQPQHGDPDFVPDFELRQAFAGNRRD